MSDLISRQAAIDEIDEWIKAFLESGHKESAADACLIQDGIIQLPSAQPEIIRCKDCIYFDKYTDGIEKYQWDGFCAHWARTTYENWYCSRAERRSDE